jgi:hypothetical protein
MSAATTKPTWPPWPPTPGRRNGGRSACRCRRPSRHAAEGEWWASTEEVFHTDYTRHACVSHPLCENNHSYKNARGRRVWRSTSKALRQSLAAPGLRRVPIVVIGAGGIVDDAHLPAYRIAGLPVAGLFDLDAGNARRAGREVGDDPRLREPRRGDRHVRGAVYDLALPLVRISTCCRSCRTARRCCCKSRWAATLDEATAILDALPQQALAGGGQLPAPLLADDAGGGRRASERDWLGRLVDVEAHLNLMTPWHLFPFLKGMERVEIAVHSIHYLDTIRALLGNPAGVHARTLGHPSTDLRPRRAPRRCSISPRTSGSPSRSTTTTISAPLPGRELALRRHRRRSRW